MTQPFPIRLMSLIVASPILLTLFGYLWFFHHFYNGLGKDEYSLGLSVYHWNILLAGILPTVCVVLLLWKGALRFTFFATITPILLVVPVTSMFPPVSRVEPDQRIIRLADGPFPNGTDVYCNGVHLGQTPLEIRVGELKAKVAPWTTPPQQPWFQGALQPLYTWYPWDRFERERYEERKMLGRDDSVLQFDARSQYWWKFEFQGSVFTVAEVVRNSSMQASQPYDDIGGYYPCYNVVALQPSAFAHRDVLTDVMDKLDAGEKRLWIEHVLKYYDLIGLKISPKVKDDRVYKDYFDAVARAAYGLSEQPTAEECRSALEQMIVENDTRKNRQFLWTEIAMYFPWGRNVYPYVYRNNFNDLFPRALTLAPRAIRQMGDASVEPLHALLEKYRYSDDGRVPLLYAAQQQKNPILFGDLARLYATTKVDIASLTANENALVVPLFEDLLRRQPLCEFLLYGDREIAWIAKMDEVVGSVDNPMLTPLIRAELERLLSKYDSYEMESELTYYVMKCWVNEKTDRDELLRWIESLNIEQGYKDQVIKRAKTRAGYYSDFQRGQIGIMLFPGKHPDLTFRQLVDWLKENPDKTIEDFFLHLDPTLNDAAKGKKIALLQILLFNQFIDDPDEAAEILRKVWADPRQRQDLMQALQRQFVVVEEIIVPSVFPAMKTRYRTQQQLRRSNDSSTSSSDFDSPIHFGGLYGQFAFETGNTEVQRDVYSKRFYDDWSLSKALYPIFLEFDDEELCVPIARELAAQDTPEALDVLRTWSESESPRLKKAATETLHGLELREKIREESKALFLELATGKIQPDDLLPKPKPWAWREGKYVQEQ